MYKSIKVKEEIYHRLIDIQHKRETLNEVVTRLINLYDGFNTIANLAEGQKEVREWEQKRGLAQAKTSASDAGAAAPPQ